jgi:hypothetical protein
VEFIAKATIHHRRQDRPQSLSAEPTIIIASGEKFDPAAIGISESEVLRLLARGHIVAPEDPDKVPQQQAGTTITGDSQPQRYGAGRSNAGVFDAVDKAIERNKGST